jgi:hypothetical protein
MVPVRMEVPAPLSPWQVRYAEWVATCSAPPAVPERLLRASQLAGYVVPKPHLAELHRRPSFKELVQVILADEVRAAHVVLRDASKELAEGHLKMARKALAAEDYDKYPKYSVPMIERVWPKAAEGHVTQTQVNISFGNSAFASKNVIEDADFAVIVEPKDTPEV